MTNVDLDHMDRLGPTITAIAREKAAIIERGDLAVTGARRARRWPSSAAGRGRIGVPLTVVDAGARPRLGPRRTDVELPGSGRRGSACAAATRPPTSPSPTRCSMRSRPPASPRAVPTPAGAGYAAARWPGRLELLGDVDGPRRCCSTAPTTRPGPPPWPWPSTTCGRSWRDGPLTLVVASMADKDVDGVIDALSRVDGAARRDRRRHDASTCRAPCPPTTWPAAGARAPASRRRSGAESTRCDALEPRCDGAGRRRRSSPARSTLSARSARTSSTTRPCATRRRTELPTDRRARHRRRTRHRPASARRRSAGASGRS